MTAPQHPAVAATGGGPRPPADMEELVTRAQAAQQAVNELGFGEVVVVKPPTFYVTLHGVDDVGYTQLVGARTTVERAQELALEHAKGQADMLGVWKQYGSGTWTAGIWNTREYYEVLAVTVTA